jgi:hypothetical protein
MPAQTAGDRKTSVFQLHERRAMADRLMITAMLRRYLSLAPLQGLAMLVGLGWLVLFNLQAFRYVVQSSEYTRERIDAMWTLVVTPEAPGRTVSRKEAVEYLHEQGQPLQRVDLNGATLSGAALAGANLRMAELARARLDNANLRGADLWRARLAGARLNGAMLRHARLRGAVLAGADLRGGDLFNADLTGSDLRGAKVTAAQLTEACGDPAAPPKLDPKARPPAPWPRPCPRR